MSANGLNVVAVRIEDKCPIVVRMIVRPKPWLAVVAPARADSRCEKAVDGSAMRNRKSHVDTSRSRNRHFLDAWDILDRRLAFGQTNRPGPVCAGPDHSGPALVRES
jgi:hypothetical protein